MRKNLMEAARELIVKKEAFSVARIIDTSGSTPRKRGACLLVKNDGSCVGSVGGGVLEAEAEKLAATLFESRENFTHHFTLTHDEQEGLDMRCGGDVTLSFEYIDEDNGAQFFKEFRGESTAYIFGGGHVGLALEPILRYVGFATEVIDDREEFVSRERFPEAGNLHVVEDYKNAFQRVHPDENAYVIIVTRGHFGDFEVLKQSLKEKHAYVGMIGSRHKVAETFRLLHEIGVSEEKLDKVDAPIGLSIHAETPEEIAISIAAEMIKVRAIRDE